MILRDLINELAAQGLVNSSDVCGALKVINSARRLLYPLDDWTGTIDYGCVNLCNSCFYLPYHLETVRDIWQCCGPVTLGDEIWSSIGTGCLADCCGEKIGVTRTDRHAPIPVQPPMGSILGIRPLDGNDKDVELRFTIRNFAGSLDTDTIKSSDYTEIVYGELIMGQIEAIQKPRTFGPIEIFWRDNRGVNCRLHVLHADEVSPIYYMYKATCEAGCAVVKAKKKYFPYTEKDLYVEVDIQGVNGIMFAINALEHQRSKQYTEYAAALKIARSHLERVKEDLKRTSGGAKAQKNNVSHPVNTTSYTY